MKKSIFIGYLLEETQKICKLMMSFCIFSFEQ